MRAALCAILLPALAFAQPLKFEGLDLKPRPKPKVEKAVDKSVGVDFTVGAPVVVVPPRRAGQKAVDVELYKLLWAALKERFGARLVPEDVTFKAIERWTLMSQLGTAEGAGKLADAVGATAAIAFDEAPTKLEARVYAAPGEAAGLLSWPWGARKVQAPLAKVMVADLLSAHGPALVGQPVAQEPLPPPEAGEDVSAEAAPSVRSQVQEPLSARPVMAFVGPGASFRSFDTASVAGASGAVVIPQAPPAMAGLGVTLAVYPLRFVKSLAQGRLADLSVEGFYRMNVAQAVMSGAGEPVTCGVTDDELLFRAAYRYPLPGRLPRVGIGVGWALERTLFSCAAPALSTRYTATELQLKVLQPVLGEQLTVEVAGGPRFVFSPHASGFLNRAFSVEGWVTTRPVRSMPALSARAGVRLTTTRLTTWPDGVSVVDTRTFVGVEVGAAL